MRALVLSGGGSAGSWQVGAINYLINDLGLTYDCYAGVSVGAINASYLSMYPSSDLKAGFQSLYNLWNNIQDSTVKKAWCPFRELTGIWKDSIYNSQPLIDLMHGSIDLQKIRASGNKIAVSAVQIATGKYVTFTQDDDNFVDGILASSSFPMGLCPITIDGYKYTDGGVRHSLPIKEAIQMGATDLDVIICGPRMPTTGFHDVDAVTWGLRCFDYMTDQMIISDLKMAFMYNKLVSAGLAPDKKLINIRVMQPAQDLPNSSLSFDNATMRALMEQGRREAKEQYKP